VDWRCRSGRRSRSSRGRPRFGWCRGIGGAIEIAHRQRPTNSHESPTRAIGEAATLSPSQRSQHTPSFVSFAANVGLDGVLKISPQFLRVLGEDSEYCEGGVRQLLSVEDRGLGARRVRYERSPLQRHGRGQSCGRGRPRGMSLHLFFVRAVRRRRSRPDAEASFSPRIAVTAVENTRLSLNVPIKPRQLSMPSASSRPAGVLKKISVCEACGRRTAACVCSRR
jgi:hypothetical protein